MLFLRRNTSCTPKSTFLPKNSNTQSPVSNFKTSAFHVIIKYTCCKTFVFKYGAAKSDTWLNLSAFWSDDKENRQTASAGISMIQYHNVWHCKRNHRHNLVFLDSGETPQPDLLCGQEKPVFPSRSAPLLLSIWRATPWKTSMTLTDWVVIKDGVLAEGFEAPGHHYVLQLGWSAVVTLEGNAGK